MQICGNCKCVREMKGWSDRRGQEERGKKAARKRELAIWARKRELWQSGAGTKPATDAATSADIVHLCTLNMYTCVQTYANMYKVIRVSCQCEPSENLPAHWLSPDKALSCNLFG